VKAKKADKLEPLWSRFEKSGSIQDYLKYHKAKLMKAPQVAVKAALKRKKAAA
jgi:hypothetical protein